MTGTAPTSLETVRRLLLGLLALGMTGTAAELWLVGHHEDWRQLIPFTAMGVSLIGLLWFGVSLSRPAVRTFRVCMVLMMLSGVTGTILHYRANREFQLEMDPSLGGMALLLKAIHAKVPPALAPGNLALLGLLGLISTLGVTRSSRTSRY